MSKVSFLNLGRQPIANGFLTKEELEGEGDEFFFDLSLSFDADNYLVSLTNFVEPEKMFNEDYHFHTSASPVMIRHFKNAANVVKKYKDKRVLEIGSNDGAFLKNFDKKNIVAVEPCKNFADYTSDIGYKTYNKFWNMETANEILEENGPMEVVYSANCMCHIQDLREAFLAVKKVMDTDGVFIFEDPNLAFMLLKNSYDQIYDEHAHIFSVYALSIILQKIGMRVFAAEKMENVHGGSCRVFACNNASKHYGDLSGALAFETSMGITQRVDYDYGNCPPAYAAFAHRVENNTSVLKSRLQSIKEEGKKIISYGATSKSTTVFNYAKIGPELIDYITDTTESKIGKFSPGMHIPIISEEEGFDNSVDFAFLGAWNYTDAIIAKHPNFSGSWLTHVPEVRTL